MPWTSGIEKKDLIDPNNTRRYYYNYKWQVLCEYSGSDEFQQWYAYGNYIDEVLAMGTGIFASTARFYIHDHLYSPAALTDYSGSVLERCEYDAYGNPYILDTQYAPRTTSNYGNTGQASKTGYGFLKVNLTPSTAQWQPMDSESWNNSGDSIDDLVSRGNSYSYTIEFKAHLGYDTPSPLSGINIYPEQETVRNVTYDPVARYISPAGDNGYDGKSVAYAWQTIDHAIHAVDAAGGGTLYFDAQNGTYTDSLQASDFYDLYYMTNCWHYNDGVYISASKSVFPSQHVSFTFMFTFDQ